METKWHYLPELPEPNVEVLIAMRYSPILMGYWDRKNWIGSKNIRDEMSYVGEVYPILFDAGYIYAWAELPEIPEVK